MGIDYGMGQSNIDPETQIRYGVISVNSVLQAWCDTSEPNYPCDDCETPEDERDDCECDATSWYIDDGEYQAETCFDGMEIMIVKAPYFMKGNYCSPCAPGAVSIDAGDGDDNKAYCLGHDWFEEGKAPYTVYSVATGKVVDPE